MNKKIEKINSGVKYRDLYIKLNELLLEKDKELDMELDDIILLKTSIKFNKLVSALVLEKFNIENIFDSNLISLGLLADLHHRIRGKKINKLSNILGDVIKDCDERYINIAKNDMDKLELLNKFHRINK